jgi:hypothetical protein
MLLDRQNKRRLIEAREEQDSMTFSGTGQPTAPDGQALQQGASPQSKGTRSVNRHSPSAQINPGTSSLSPARAPSPIPEDQACTPGDGHFGLDSLPNTLSPEVPTSTPGVKYTPSSLDWPPNTDVRDLLKLYNFVVQKGKEPYFELQPPWTASQQTPERVYLDPLVFQYTSGSKRLC